MPALSNPALPATKHQSVVHDNNLLNNSRQAVWGISAQAGDLHSKLSKSLEPTMLTKKTEDNSPVQNGTWGSIGQKHAY